MIDINGQSFRTSRPATLDDQLIATTGLNAAEVRSLLRGNPLAHHVARAVKPFLIADAPPIHELTTLIEREGVTAVALKVVALYGGEEAPATEAESATE